MKGNLRKRKQWYQDTKGIRRSKPKASYIVTENPEFYGIKENLFQNIFEFLKIMKKRANEEVENLFEGEGRKAHSIFEFFELLEIMKF